MKIDAGKEAPNRFASDHHVSAEEEVAHKAAEACKHEAARKAAEAEEERKGQEGKLAA